MGKYFDKFPLVDYNGIPAKNILAKVDFTEETKRDIYSSFDYVLEDTGTRADFLSHAYYNSSRYDWLVYLTNGVIDPYHDFHMTEANLNEFIKNKYNGSPNQYETILYFRNNWSPDQSLITETIYENMTMDIKKYYKPRLNNTNQIIGYERRQDDWIRSTNMIVRLDLEGATNYYTVGSLVKKGSTTAIVEVVDTVDNYIIVKHVINGPFVVGDELEESEAVVTGYTILSQIIPDIEAPFWAPVRAYEYETEMNSIKRYISLIKSSYLPDVDKLLTQQLKA